MDINDIVKTKQVEEDIQCKTCKFKDGGGMKYPHYTKAHCEMYPSPDYPKPNAVLFDKAKCVFYVKE
jgi:hypothetical protein